MARYNHVMFEGNMGKDPDVRDKLTTFQLAVWQGKDRPTMWLHCKSFEAPVCASRGQKVRVTGRLYFETYMANDGMQKTVWGVIVDEVEPIERAPKQQQQQTEAVEEDCPF